MNNERRQSGELSRDLSMFHITMMGVGMMIGAGVFVSTGIGIGVAGPGGILIAFTFNGLIAFLSSMTYAELASAIPRTGGGYTYIQEGIGGIVGFFSGWMFWFANAITASLYCITFSKYVLHFISQVGTFKWLNLESLLVEKIMAITIALIFIYVNYRGSSDTGIASAFIATGQTTALVLIGIIGVFIAFKKPTQMQNFEPFLPNGWGKIMVAMGFSYVGYEGYEVIAQTSEEVVDAKKNVPKAIFYAVMIVITTYLLVAFAAVVGVKPFDMSVVEWFNKYGATGFAKAIGQLFPFGGLLATLSAVFASTSALNATVYSATRVSFALGRDGHLPEFFANISDKTNIPNVALLFSSILIIIIAAAFPVEAVAAGADILFLLLFAIVNYSVIKVRKEQGDELNYGYLMPFFPYIPLTVIVLQLLLIVFLFDMGVLAYIVTGTWTFIGALIYNFYSKLNINQESD